MKGHPPTWSERFSSKSRWILGFILLFIGFYMFQTQRATAPSDIAQQSDVKLLPENQKTATNTCNWRPEPLAGQCDVTKPTEESKKYDNAIDCENACCETESCVSFQFREKEGCQWGGDTRLGAEKDGVPAWCEPRAPAPWKGQWIKKHEEKIDGACDDKTWNPKELSGQCFGLGPKQKIEPYTAESCRDSCCENTNCAIWQFREDAGCFYGKHGHGCMNADPLDFERFIGKRKVQEGREYKPYAYTKDFTDLAGSEFKG